MYATPISLAGGKKEYDLTQPDENEILPRKDLADTIFVFRNDEMLINKFSSGTGWFVGDVQNGMQVPDYCSLVRVDPIIHKTNAMDGIISGGLMSGLGG